MPGTITLKPIQANLTHNTSVVSGMDPYCKATIGSVEATSSICYNGGTNPYWFNEALILQVHDESKCLLAIKDKAMLLNDSDVGIVELDVKEIETQGNVARWFPITFNNKTAGEILLEASFNSTSSNDKQDHGVPFRPTKTPLHQLFENSNGNFCKDEPITKTPLNLTTQTETDEISKKNQKASANLKEIELNDKKLRIEKEICLKSKENLDDNETSSNLTNKATSEAFEDPNGLESEIGSAKVLIIDRSIFEASRESNVFKKPSEPEYHHKFIHDQPENQPHHGLDAICQFKSIDQLDVQHPALLSMDDHLTRRRSLYIED